MEISAASSPRPRRVPALLFALVAGAAILLPGAIARADAPPAAQEPHAAAPAADPGHSAQDDHATRVKIRVEDRDGSSVHIDLASTWLTGLIRSADIACKAEADRQARAMMQALDEQGEGGVYSYTDDDDGDRVVARRSRGALKIESTDRDGKVSVVEMPWDAARCLMLGIDPPGDLGQRIARGEAKLRFDVRDRGDRVRISVE